MRPNFPVNLLFRRLPQLARVCWGLMLDRRVPKHLKLIPVGAVLYLLLPCDLIPDFVIPVVGEIDDFLVLFLAFRLFLGLVPEDVLLEHQRRVGW